MKRISRKRMNSCCGMNYCGMNFYSCKMKRTSIRRKISYTKI
jgi:hypothetical protein